MVDGHEHNKQKKHRTHFTTKYLTAIEPWCHCLVQLTQGQFHLLPAHNNILLATDICSSDAQLRQLVKFMKS